MPLEIQLTRYQPFAREFCTTGLDSSCSVDLLDAIKKNAQRSVKRRGDVFHADRFPTKGFRGNNGVAGRNAVLNFYLYNKKMSAF